jgi:hypothetical protein
MERNASSREFNTTLQLLLLDWIFRYQQLPDCQRQQTLYSQPVEAKFSVMLPSSQPLIQHSKTYIINEKFLLSDGVDSCFPNFFYYAQ